MSCSALWSPDTLASHTVVSARVVRGVTRESRRRFSRRSRRRFLPFPPPTTTLAMNAPPAMSIA